MNRRSIFSIVAISLTLASGCAAGRQQVAPAPPVTPSVDRPWIVRPEHREIASQVEIIRTGYGVPHIKASNLRALGFGMAWCQAEDYGQRAAQRLIAARGEAAEVFADTSMIGSDAWRKLIHARAVETYHLLPQDVRDVNEGFAAGINFYMSLHQEEFEGWPEPDFTGHDVSALTVGGPNLGMANRFVRRMQAAPFVSGGPAATDSPLPESRPALIPEPPSFLALDGTHDPDVGSNVWAFAPSRTRSGNAILVRNPHLAWDAGYYEAHLIVPGVLEFYGDIRIGGAFAIIGGFNPYLGWSTTNNAPDLDEIYELDLDPDRADHYLFDGASLPIRFRDVRVAYTTPAGEPGMATRAFQHTPLGPVIYRTESKVYVIRSANHGGFRRGEQYLRMMQARNLEEWLDAMLIRAIGSSNYTYADRDGNIYYVWNASTPVLPHEAGEDEAIPASSSNDIWTQILPFDQLPMVLNPEGGYLMNSNDPPFYTNLNEPLDPIFYPDNLPEPRLRLRSQHSLQLVHPERLLSLEEIVELKHSMRMLLADRVKDDLIAVVRDSIPSPEVEFAVSFLEAWDNTVAAESRGGVLFEAWWSEYTRALSRRRIEQQLGAGSLTEEDVYEVPWTPDDPTGTPRGLAHPDLAAAAFARAVEATRERWGSWDVAWGEVHRVRLGDVDVPVGGGSGGLGCFRVLSFRRDDDGKLVVSGGDGWVLAVEFGDPPRAYSILGYGQSIREDSPYFADQAEMFARNEMKQVALTEEEIQAQAIRQYRPGSELRVSQRRKR